MARILTMINLKGGSGKTTTAVNLSASLAIFEKRTLLIDCDPQGNATIGLGIDKRSLNKSFYHTMIDGQILSENLVQTSLDYLSVLPSRIESIRAEIQLADNPDKEKILQNAIATVSNDYDYIILDTSPSIGLITVNALIASTEFIIPLPCEFYALETLGQVLKTIKLIRGQFNPSLKFSGILLSMFQENEEISNHIAQEIRTYLQHKVFQTVIPYDIGLKESPSHGQSILTLNIQSIGSQRFLDLANEIINQV
ncbi:MAG: Cobyrinic acid a,c-diamide synthase [Candidatus Magnetoglobus multicellularis str. Araruama]|uniref:Cobyrinic acid a,c-diamide synthase n=1 Tax=Candidatus Magnetoglobus multicellularis str. Araruama TaxID=890399 RepID=A0A1V1PCB4_9BACT|nr:MAG: Cobyrinic acid a,c-diamide synthase [Candidatus Magnetoglobus multicellularis str. Araruama]